MPSRQLVVAFETSDPSAEHPVSAVEQRIMEAFSGDGWSLDGRFCSVRVVSYILDDHAPYRSALANKARASFSPLPAEGFIPSADSLGVVPTNAEIIETASLPEVRQEFTRPGFTASATVLHAPGALGRSWARTIIHPDDLQAMHGLSVVLTDFSALLDFGGWLAWIECVDLDRSNGSSGNESAMLQSILIRLADRTDSGST